MYGQSFFQPNVASSQALPPPQSPFNVNVNAGPSSLQHQPWNVPPMDRDPRQHQQHQPAPQQASGLLGGIDIGLDSPGPPGKRSAGGRPRDRVWELFEGDREVARCRYCQWKTDHPKAFRMRQHVLICDAVPADKKVELEQWVSEKVEKKAQKEERQQQDGTPVQTAPKKVKRDAQPVIMPPVLRSPITCHVLDSTSGKPAPEMRVRLDRLTATGFEALSQALTDNDGRVGTLLPGGSKLDAGIYKITFFTQDYFTKRGINSFYPFVEIPFDVKLTDEHYHIPLLLSPYAYSTYRGS